MVKRLISWYKKIEAKRLARRAIQLDPGVFDRAVQERAVPLANRLATDAVRKYFLREGLAHCEICLRRFPLQVIGNSYFCKTHFQQRQSELSKGESANV